MSRPSSLSNFGAGLALFANGDAAVVSSAESYYVSTTGADVYHPLIRSARASAAGCPAWLDAGLPYAHVLGTNLVIGRNAWSYFGAADSSPTGLTGLVAANANGSPVSLQGACSASNYLFPTNNGGSDALVCDGMSKWTFTGAFAQSWTVASTVSPTYLLASATSTILGSAGTNTTAGLDLNSGTATVGNFPAQVWLVDASATPIVFDSNGATVEARVMNGTSIGASPYALPSMGAAVADMILSNTGVLYVAAGGVVSAIYTDSTSGLGTGNFGWPARGRDACRSSSLEYACPY